MRVLGAVSDRRVRALALGLLLATPLALAGCHRQSDPATKPASPAAARPAPKADSSAEPGAADPSRTMAAAVTLGPRTAPVEARYDLPAAPTPGQVFKLDIAILPQAASPLVRVELRPSKGLTVLDPVTAQSLERVQAGAVLRLPVTLQAAAAGTHVLDVAVTLELPTGPESRAFAVPLIVTGGQGK